LLHGLSDEQRAERREKRRDAESADQHAVERANYECGGETAQCRRQHAHMMCAQQHERETGDVDGRAERQIDRTQGQCERHAKRGDSEQCEVVEKNVGEIAGPRKTGRKNRKESDHGDQCAD